MKWVSGCLFAVFLLTVRDHALRAQTRSRDILMNAAERAYALDAGSESYQQLLLEHERTFAKGWNKARSQNKVAFCPAWLLESARASSASATIRKLRKRCPSHNATAVTAASKIEPAGKHFAYNPVLLSLVAGLDSRSYDRGKPEEWQTVTLDFPSGRAGRYFQRPVKAHVRRGDPADSHVFIILNSSYSTWKRGTWTNKTIVALRTVFPGCHLIVMAGFLTPEVLSAEPKLPDLTAELTAADLYERFALFIAQQQSSGVFSKTPSIGLIGFSGGANLVMSLLQRDSVDGSSSHPRLFSSGGVAFSPIVDLQGTFAVLDGSSEVILKTGFPASHGLTTLPNMIGLAMEGYLPNHVSKFLSLLSDSTVTQPRAKDFVNRFYREFEIVDLKTVASAPYVFQPSCDEHLSFSSYYAGCVFPWQQQQLQGKIPQSLKDYSSIERLTANITASVYVVFALDDPVLSRSAVASGIEANGVRAALATLKAHPNFRVFTPAAGAHLGYMLDSVFLFQSLEAFFSR